jgi:hypothetical protein
VLAIGDARMAINRAASPVNHNRNTLLERMSHLEVGRESALDAAWIEQERQPRSTAIPQLRFHWRKHALE